MEVDDSESTARGSVLSLHLKSKDIHHHTGTCGMVPVRKHPQNGSTWINMDQHGSFDAAVLIQAVKDVEGNLDD